MESSFIEICNNPHESSNEQKRHIILFVCKGNYIYVGMSRETYNLWKKQETGNINCFGKDNEWRIGIEDMVLYAALHFLNLLSHVSIMFQNFTLVFWRKWNNDFFFLFLVMICDYCLGEFYQAFSL